MPVDETKRKTLKAVAGIAILGAAGAVAIGTGVPVLDVLGTVRGTPPSNDELFASYGITSQYIILPALTQQPQGAPPGAVWYNNYGGGIWYQDSVQGITQPLGPAYADAYLNLSYSPAWGALVPSLNPTDGASYNTALGAYTMTKLSTGSYNTAIGAGAGEAITTSHDNTVVGSGAMKLLTGGMPLPDHTSSENTAVGSAALSVALTAHNNTALGCLALEFSVADVQNVAVGYAAMEYTNGGSYNTAVGTNALTSNVAGSDIVAVGNGCLQASLSGYNTAVGGAAFYLLTTGGGNVGVGYNCATGLLTGNNNTIIGSSAGSAYTGGESGNILIGQGVSGAVGESDVLRIGTMVLAAGSNTALGRSALGSLTSGLTSVAIGDLALAGTTTDTGNVAVGYTALQHTDGGSNNTAVGIGALLANVTGPNNVAIGAAALQASLGGYNTGIGNAAMYEVTTGAGNVAVGFNCMNNLTTGGANVAIGTGAGIAYTSSETQNVVIGANVTGVVGESSVLRIGSYNGSGGTGQIVALLTLLSGNGAAFEYGTTGTSPVSLGTGSTSIFSSPTSLPSGPHVVIVTVYPTANSITGTVTVTYKDGTLGGNVTQTQSVASTTTSVPQSFIFLCNSVTGTAIAVAGTSSTASDLKATAVLFGT